MFIVLTSVWYGFMLILNIVTRFHGLLIFSYHDNYGVGHIYFIYFYMFMVGLIGIYLIRLT